MKSRSINRLCLFLGALLCAQGAWSATLQGRVIGISDGDTLTLLDASREPHKVRLASIDAPEKSQPYGQRARKSLAALAYDKTATVEWYKLDRYGRVIGKVLVGGHDIGLDQLRQGMAWHYRQYEADQSPVDLRAYDAAEDAAREARAGLWRDRDPVPPWEFRHRSKMKFLRNDEDDPPTP